MKVIKLTKKNFPEFVETLKKEGEIWAPIKKNDKYVFNKIDNALELNLSTPRTILPPKKFFHPPNFSMFRFTSHGYFEEFSDIKTRIILGIHPCDIHGILILDKLFTHEYPDPYYLIRRDKTIIIGHSCIPDDKCFCQSTRTHVVEEGFDLFLTDLDDYYLVWIGSSKGDDLIRLKPEIFEEKIQQKDIEKFIKWKNWRDSQFKLQIDFTALPDIMELKYYDHLWEDIASSCLACGSCTMVCPTCNCYNVSDYFYIGKEEGQRSRFWDSCMFKEYSEVAGGHNFREKKADRLKLWYTHKLQAYISAYGKYSCVGCGRCIDTCPVDINVKTVAQALRGEPIEAFWKRRALKEEK